jgi:hypothetical protein
MSFLPTQVVLTTVGENQTVLEPLTDQRADVLQRSCHDSFYGEELPVPVKAQASSRHG